MATYTKMVIAHWLEWADDAYREKRDNELAKLVNAGKTDGVMNVAGYDVYRLFVDLESAQYWDDWLTLNAPAGLLLGTEIVDAPENI